MMIEWMCSVLVQQTEQCRRYIDQSQWDSAKLLNYSEENRRKETEMIKASSDHVVWVIVCRWLSGQLHPLHLLVSVLVSVPCCLQANRQTDRQTHVEAHYYTSVWPLKKRSSTAPSSPPVESEREFWLVLALALFVIHWLTLFLPYVCVCVVLSVFFHSIPSITDAQSTLRCLSSLQTSGQLSLPWCVH